MNNQIRQKELRRQIDLLLASGNVDCATPLINEYELLDNTSADFYTMRSIAAMLINEVKTAEGYLRQGLARHTENGDLLYNMAYLKDKQGNIALSLQYYKQALAVITDSTVKAHIIERLNVLDKHSEPKCNHSAAPKRILIGSPIHQKPLILNEFLSSLSCLDTENLEIAYLFIDDNIDENASKLLQKFQEEHPAVTIHKNKQEKEIYTCDNTTHQWKESLIWKVAQFKNMILQIALEHKFDYTFLIDSDLVLHPYTLQQLITAQKDILSNVFWTKWQPAGPLLPQVWLYDHYTQFEMKRGEQLTQEAASFRLFQFLEKLKKPGVYKVGGLGACTLISRKALETGVNFNEIPNITMWGEDRHFCIRALALGLSLHVDTHLPAFHIYRESDLQYVNAFKRQSTASSSPICVESPRSIQVKDNCNDKITLSMIIKNEADRYLKQVLEAARPCINAAVIIDDGSKDNSILVCKQILSGIPLKIVRNKHSLFKSESSLRQLQWNETIKTNPGWILNLDADEILEKKFIDNLKQLIDDSQVHTYCFHLFDFWNETQYRDDQYWCAHRSFMPFLVKYNAFLPYQWNEQPQHCGRFPANILKYPSVGLNLRIKHMGWASEADRLSKAARYAKLDPEAKYGIKAQYDSILDKSPHLLDWVE